MNPISTFVCRGVLPLVVLLSSAMVARAADEFADRAEVSAVLAPDGGHITVEARGVQPVLPGLFNAAVQQTTVVNAQEVASEAKVSVHVLQGNPDVFSLGLVGDGEVVAVTGTGLRDWSVRRDAEARRYLDLRPLRPAAAPSVRDFDFVVQLRRSDVKVPERVAMPLVVQGAAVGYDWRGRFEPDSAVSLEVKQATGVVAAQIGNADDRTLEYVAQGQPAIVLAVLPRGAAVPEVALSGARLVGTVDENAKTVEFKLHVQATSAKSGARVRLLGGAAGLVGATAGDGWHANVADDAGYDLVFERSGTISVDLAFSAAVRVQDDWRRLDLQLSAGTVVPVFISGLPDAVEFDRAAAVVLDPANGGWQGYLPGDGNLAVSWRRLRQSSEGTLFFTSTEQSEIRVGAGLLRQVSRIAVRVMQGQLQSVRLRVDGPGEIVGVDGTNVVGWKAVSTDKTRVIDVQLSRPIEADGALVVQSQAVLGGFPVRVEPLRLTPEGGVRHSGFVRVANAGAVRLELADVDGMMQLAPAQYPGQPLEAGTRQVFVYRFPTGARRFTVLASQILPEVGVSQVTTYTVGETDRIIESDLELDVREAAFRDWALRIPSDYAVVSVQGAAVSDYTVESGAGAATPATEKQGGAGGRSGRELKLFFAQPVLGRQLVHLRLEKSQAAAAGEWALPPLDFPDAKSVRGYVGVVAAPGFRLVQETTAALAEVPLSFFPKQTTGLQQAYRLRAVDWSAATKIEALGQSIQADVFHLYSLKEGAVAASVLINYFVVGAPASEWRIAVPAEAGNIDVTGQGVRREWRREGNVIVVTLHQPVLGASTLLITFELPMSARGGTIRPGEVQPLGVQSERGYLQVVSPLQVRTTIAKAEGNLLKLEPLELPAELRLFTSAPSLAAYQYTARPFDLAVGVQWYQPGDTVDRVIDFAKLASQVARDGQVVTDVQLFVKTRGRKLLRFQLPPQVKLWETRVDNELVTARSDGDWTVVPLTAHLNPNEPVRVALRIGQPAEHGSRNVTLAAPKMGMPLVLGEWTLQADRGRLLVPAGGTAQPTAPNLTETGFEWILAHARISVLLMLVAAGLGAWMTQMRTGLGAFYTLLAGGFALLVTISLVSDAAVNRRVNLSRVVYAATILPNDGLFALRVANVPAWQAMLSGWGMASLAAAVACGIADVRRRRAGRDSRGALTAAAVILAGAGLLAQRGGAVLFFIAVATAILSFILVPGGRNAWHAWTHRRRSNAPSGSTAGPSTAVSAVVAACLSVWLLHGNMARAANVTDWAGASGSAQAIVQRWDIHDHRLFGELDVTVRGAPGDSFLLLNAPAILTDFSGAGLRVASVPRDDGAAYYVSVVGSAADLPAKPLAAARGATYTARAKFELPVPDLAKGLPLLTGPAAVQRVTIQLDQPGWDFSSPRAVAVLATPGLPGNQSGATLVLALEGAPVVALVPKSRNVDAETVRFFAETSHLFVPGPGVVNESARVGIRPVQGRVATIELVVPDGFSVGDVGGGPVGRWRFDPEKHLLHVAIEPAQDTAFRFLVQLQQPASALPFALKLHPIRVVGAEGDVGAIGLAFGGDAQPEQIVTTATSTVSTDDFDRELLPRGRDGAALATLLTAYRYSRADAEISLRVAPVAPEVRVATRELISLGDDRVVVAADLNVAILRVGLFQLSLALPPGLELEAATGPALSHWTEADDNGARVVTLHLTGRTLGEQTFALTLSGPAVAGKAWSVPRISLREATRQTGELQVVPDRGMQLRPIDRQNVSELDPRSIGNARPGALAFRILEADWALSLGIETLDPWVTVQALKEVTAREGQTLTRLALQYRVENAAVKELRIALPGITEEQAKTLRATGPAVSDLVAVPGSSGQWVIRLQHGIIGETTVQIEYQGSPPAGNGAQPIATPDFVGARQVTQFVAVRGGGRLEIEAPVLLRGWQRVDWSAVPAVLQDRADRSVPALTFRVAEPEKPLEIVARRNAVADALKLRVTGGQLRTIFSPTGPSLTSVDLRIDVAEKSTLRVRLPETAQLFNTIVNGESVAVVREGDAYLFHVSGNTSADPTATVRLVYSVTSASAGRILLAGPRFNVPLENVTWQVVVPPGYDLSRYRGELQLQQEGEGGWFGVGDYESTIASKRVAEARQGTEFLQAASVFLQKGQQRQASEVLMRAANASSLDAASNEDARVQLRALRTDQTILGLNTRRQRLYLDNSAEAMRNEQLEQAANLNPLMHGKTDFDPQQLDQMLMGNTVEENAALRGIADRIVDQQLAAEPAPRAIDVTLPERGRVYTFARSLQVNGDSPLELSISIARAQQSGVGFGLALLVGIGAIVAFATRRKTA